jgi:D-amino peptidase
VISIPFRHILIIADIEGCSGCWSYQSSSFLTSEWRVACFEMTKDVNAVVKSVFEAGVERITVKDFHRTGYNILPEGIDSRATVDLGYRRGPVPGIGDPGDADALMLLGMHAASGTEGFLAHTMTSRIERLEVNGNPLAEVELFSASLAPYGIRPIFFSGCPVACRQATEAISHIDCYPIDKSSGPSRFDPYSWRTGLACAARASIRNYSTRPYLPEGPFRTVVTLRDGKVVAEKIARKWGFQQEGNRIFFKTCDFHVLYMNLIRLCYLTPLVEKTLPFGLFLYNLVGRFGQAWVRRHWGGKFSPALERSL